MSYEFDVTHASDSQRADREEERKLSKRLAKQRYLAKKEKLARAKATRKAWEEANRDKIREYNKRQVNAKKNWKEKLKADPVRYAEFLAKERERHKRYREQKQGLKVEKPKVEKKPRVKMTEAEKRARKTQKQIERRRANGVKPRAEYLKEAQAKKQQQTIKVKQELAQQNNEVRVRQEKEAHLITRQLDKREQDMIEAFLRKHPEKRLSA